MSNVFLIGCTHFGHENMYKFLNKDGTRVRHQFADAKQGDEAMIDRWNATVCKGDKVYVEARLQTRDWKGEDGTEHSQSHQTQREFVIDCFHRRIPPQIWLSSKSAFGLGTSE